MAPTRTRLNDGLEIFTQEEVRLARATATLIDFDCLPGGDQLLLGSPLVLERITVPVFEGNKKIGAASLYASGHKIMALISFDYESPERLDMSIGSAVHAIPRGDFYVDPEGEVMHTVDYIEISGIDLSTSPSKRKGFGSPLLPMRYDENEV